MVNWDDYRYLIAVEKHGSLAAAARQLGVSQPTVGRRMAALSKALGVTLLENHADGARLSAIGRQVCDRAKSLEQQATMIELVARPAAAESVHRVRIAASSGLSRAVLVPVLGRFQSARPDISIDLVIGTRMADLRHDEADIALRIGDPSDDALVGRRICTIEFGLFAHDVYLARGGTPSSLGDLNDHAVIESTGDIAGLPQAVLLRNAAPRARVTLSTSSVTNQVEAMKVGLGLVALPTYLASDLGGVRRVLTDQFSVNADVWLLFRADASQKPSVREVFEHLIDEVPKRLRTLT